MGKVARRRFINGQDKNVAIILRGRAITHGCFGTASRRPAFVAKAELLLLSVVAVCALPQNVLGKLDDAAIQPFHARGVITSETFRLRASNVVFRAETFFTFSNGIWEIELRYTEPSKYVGSGSNCKRIPEGVRFYDFASVPIEQAVSNSLDPATALSINFPPPEFKRLLTCWLSLCPNPELPLLDSTRMRRFISTLNHGPFQDPKNEGSYSLKYLHPENVFVSELSITNNGMNWTFEGGRTQFPEPFQQGFLEFSYRVLATTNVFGKTFPLQTVLRNYAPKSDAKTASDILVSAIETLCISEISMSPLDRRPQKTLFALDERSPILPKEVSMRYIVTNDQWLPASDPRMVELASIYAMATRPAQPRPPEVPWVALLTFFLTFSAVLSLAVFLRHSD